MPKKNKAKPDTRKTKYSSVKSLSKRNESRNTDNPKIDRFRTIPDWLPILIFTITTCIFFWDQLIGNTYFWEDFVEQFLPIQTFAAQAFSNFEIPFWNPYTFCGMPFFADLQVGFFYPMNRLSVLFLNSDGQLSVWGLQFIIILHFFIAQVSMYKLMRYLKVSSPGSIIASISFAFSFSMVLHVIHPMMVYHLAWFPLVLKYFMMSLSEYKIKYGIIAGLLLGFSMLAGHPQTILYEALFLGMMMLWYLIAGLKKGDFKENSIIKFLLGGGLTFVISVSIFLVQYLPSQDLADLSKRGEASYEAATEGSLELEQIYTAVTPKLFGFIDGAGDNSLPYYLNKNPYYYYWDTSYYFGLTALVLGLLAIFTGYKNRQTAFLIFISVFGFLFALGDNFILFKMFYNLPFFGLLRIPARIMFFSVISFSILGGFGYDYILDNIKQKKAHKKLLYASILPVIVALLITTGFIQEVLSAPTEHVDSISGFGTISLMMVLCILICLILMIRGILKPLAAAMILIILTFTDLYIQGATFNSSKNDPQELYRIDGQAKEAFTSKGKEDLFRVSMRHYNPSYMAMKRNQGMIDRIQLVEGYNQLVFNYIPPPCDVETIHDLYNVRYELKYEASKNQFRFIERTNYYPRAWMVYDAHITENVKTYMENNQQIDYAKSVILEEKPEFQLSEDIVSIDNSIKIKEYENNYILVEANTEKNGILVFSEIWYPDWKVYIDGKETKLYRANYSFRAVAIPKGSHKVEMSYESSKFTAGLAISLSAIVLSIVGLVLLRDEDQ